MKKNSDKSQIFAYYWNILTAGLRPPVAEYPFDSFMGRKHRFDWAWPDYKIAVEVDGGQYAAHGGKHSEDRDREKLNIAASLGWLVFRFSPDQLTNDPDECMGMVKKAYQMQEQIAPWTKAENYG